MDGFIAFVMGNFTLTFLVIGAVFSLAGIARSPRPLAAPVAAEPVAAFVSKFSDEDLILSPTPPVVRDADAPPGTRCQPRRRVCLARGRETVAHPGRHTHPLIPSSLRFRHLVSAGYSSVTLWVARDGPPDRSGNASGRLIVPYALGVECLEDPARRDASPVREATSARRGRTVPTAPTRRAPGC